eukprot:m.454008 g.454008  ORF g.454008 m.454008 type:complete len:554 (+) comp21561_c0_seq2:567-2228(+)
MEDYEWVEILEPGTKQKMYANVITGECMWEAPSGIPVKSNHENQWWELLDTKTQRPYFYNATNQSTVWERPESGDIIKLSKLQEMQDQLAKDEAARLAQEKADPEPATAAAPVAAASPVDPVDPVDPATSQPQNSQKGAIPVAPPMPAKESRRVSQEALSDYGDNLNRHKKGFIMKKRVSIATMLAWSKDVIPSPMLLTIRKTHKRDAIDLFRLVQMCMGDRNARGRSFVKIALTVVVKTWSVPNLRDELYLQLCKQTTSNNSNVPTSCERGWELMAISVNFNPPSKKFFSYLEGYVNRNTTDSTPQRIREYAAYCLKRLNRIRDTGAKRGNNQPTIEEVELAQKNIFNPSMYGSTLEEVMEVQAEKKPELEIPWVVLALVNAILTKKGAQTEGIFRVPGDIDAVNMLKVSLDKFEVSENYSEPHVPASALKLWFRELQEPLIPETLYENCISSYDDSARAIAVLDLLPPVNRLLLTYAIRFLQVVGQKENQAVTKMTPDNLAMVWAPNFLRCPSEDPLTIFNNTKKEMSFVRQLVLHLDTAGASHLGLEFNS